VAGNPGLAGPDVERLPAEPGSYALVLHSAARRTIRVGALGRVTIPSGFLIYVGSAFGPGGIRARVGRHARKSKPAHWHIDYVRRHVALEEVWWTTATARQEHQWARRLARRLVAAAPGFGASDCRCPTHLYHTIEKPAAGIVAGEESVCIWLP